jgi:hypothetical protein
MSIERWIGHDCGAGRDAEVVAGVAALSLLWHRTAFQVPGSQLHTSSQRRAAFSFSCWWNLASVPVPIVTGTGTNLGREDRVPDHVIQS